MLKWAAKIETQDVAAYSQDRKDRYSVPQKIINRWVTLEEAGYFKD